MAKTHWRGDEAKDRLHAAIDLTFDDLGRRLVETGKDLVSTPFPPASLPFSTPHARTYDLWRSFAYRVTRGRLRFTNTSEHALPLERGTAVMEPRPFMEPTVRRVAVDLYEREGLKLKARLRGT